MMFVITEAGSDTSYGKPLSVAEKQLDIYNFCEESFRESFLNISGPITFDTKVIVEDGFTFVRIEAEAEALPYGALDPLKVGKHYEVYKVEMAKSEKRDAISTFFESA